MPASAFVWWLSVLSALVSLSQFRMSLLYVPQKCSVAFLCRSECARAHKTHGVCGGVGVGGGGWGWRAGGVGRPPHPYEAKCALGAVAFGT